jgi:large subunit ribosomal protein L5e
MSFLKITKNKTYHSRFQVKWRRRREGKTDYYSRKRLIFQDKRNFNSVKYRLVVRFSQKNIISQLIQSRIEGDHIVQVVYSKQLKNFGIETSLTSFPSAYLTGYLIGKKFFPINRWNELQAFQTKFLKKKILKKNKIQTNKEILQKEKGLSVILDIGLTRASKGNKVFALMKGAVDAGLNIPYNEKRFPGYSNDQINFSIEKLNHRIKGQHIADYMKEIKEEDNEYFEKQFRSANNKKIFYPEFLSMFSSALTEMKKL